MNKIETKYHTELKSWPYKEASQIIKRQGGYSNFKIPEKKFILSILPLITSQNNKISATRSRLLNMQKFLNTYKTLNNKNQLFLYNLALRYSVDTLNKHKIDIINELLEHVDEIPNLSGLDLSNINR